jgi:quercetin dioxygenase-like cupin family protein
VKINHGRVADARSEQRGTTFTGEVWADPVLQGIQDVLVNAVFFTPGGRTFWHRHEEGQILLVTQGRGYVQTREGEGGWVTPGDVVFFEAGEEHWHGAGDASYLVHTAISLGATEWLEEVTEEDYRSAVEST